jgi:hypothetical protein
VGFRKAFDRSMSIASDYPEPINVTAGAGCKFAKLARLNFGSKTDEGGIFAVADVYVAVKRLRWSQKRVNEIAASMLEEGQQVPIRLRRRRLASIERVAAFRLCWRHCRAKFLDRAYVP